MSDEATTRAAPRRGAGGGAFAAPAVGSPDDGVPEGAPSAPGATVRLADWMMGAIARSGIRHVFMVAGGGAMHLDDAAGAHPGLEVVCFLHEQAAAIAAEAYAKVAGIPALCLVTTGPGGTNAITGVAGGFLDSTPMLVVSGQVKRADRVGSTGVRQRGIQELDICRIVAPITKDARVVEDQTEVRRELERALLLARSGRPGPVWLDVPLDVQGAPIDPDRLAGYDPSEAPPQPQLAGRPLADAARRVAGMLAEAERPLLLAGAGVRLAGAEERFRSYVERAGVPVLTTWPAMGVVGEEHPLHVGRPGSLAPRGANFALQCADVLVTIGARLDLATTGYDPKDFGRRA
ncbi:MAG TPA: thiamine pyrophosphate-binding protein, partial [Acidimicrobiales bacterium]|nr:thiamine pyrophosphate-binding protein [Acidimicrobiales bacterium]